MPLSSESFVILHILQNVALLALAILFTPLVTIISLTGQIISSHTPSGNAAKHDREQALLSKDHILRTVLVTGVGMSKGLAIARAFYRHGHTVIAADFEPYKIPVCGRFSRAIHKFYRLSKPRGGEEHTGYVEHIIDIITREKVDIWISCSGVSSAVEDAIAAEMVERKTPCKAIQFGVELTKVLHEKHTFIQQTEHFSLKVPLTELTQSTEGAMRYFYKKWSPSRPLDRVKSDLPTEYILKPVGVEDSRRANMTLLPMEDSVEALHHIRRLDPSLDRPFVIQKFIQGKEYCTHALIVRGQVKAFTACRSAELLMHYRALSPDSEILQEMLRFTQTYAGKLGDQATGHFSVDFMVDEKRPEDNLRDRLYPIECNPRAHTAVVLFNDIGQDMVDAYLSVLDVGHQSTEEKSTVTNEGGSHQSTTDSAHTNINSIVVPDVGVAHYWAGHEFVTRVVLPMLNLLNLFNLRSDVRTLARSWQEFADHVLNWKDGTFEVWDPWPFWALYCVYWPSMFVMSILTQSWWSRCNVSTTKMFRC